MLTIERVWPADVLPEWHAMAKILNPAIMLSGEGQLDLIEGVVRGRLQCWRLEGDAEGFVLTSVGWSTDSGARCLWPKFAAGKITGQRRATVRRIMADFEDMARRDGCAETRIEAVREGWVRFFPDYEPNGRNGETIMLRKVL